MLHALSIQNLSKTYAGGVQALKGISLDMAEGDFFALLGPNGAGKSTAIGIICSLVNPGGGDVQVFGHSLRRDPAGVKRQIGLVPQEFNFNPFEPVAEILVNQAGYYGIPRRRAWGRAEQYLKQLELWDKRAEQARDLSGGMKRRLMIARALMHRPRLLILDEPTAGVDIEIRRSMWDYLRGINEEGVSIILTTHYLEEAESLCRTLAIINQGEIVEHSNVQELLTRLSSESFMLNLKQPVAQVAPLPDYWLAHPEPGVVEVCISRGQSLNRVFAHLDAQGIEVASLRNKQNRLEQLFIGLLQQGREKANG
ncbi:ABC transporter ATP-binding protein [Magnetovirga frankeli]|uniref:ABC transporter ATP-binding protein n=1 Tax=Magnetovirga frankeli TaxID=947516 RepID=UPI001292F12A|nr:ABC transporter ATP-binding protein [gamma proteobacterium SS-5]